MKSILIGFAATVLFCASALAGPVVDEATNAESLAEGGKAFDAVIAMDRAVAKLWDQVPLTFLEARFVASRPAGYGNYDPRENSTFDAGDEMLIYVEMAGYEYRKDGDFYFVDMSVDVEVKKAGGEVLGGQKDIAKLTMKSRVPNREFFGVLTYEFSGIPSGTYVATTTITDKNSRDVSSFDLEFQIR